MVRMSQPSFETQRSTVSKFVRLECQKLSPRIGNIVSHVPNTVDKRMAMRHLKQTCTGGQANEHKEPWPTAYQSRYVRGQLGNGYMICPPDDKCLGDLSTDKDSESDSNPHLDLTSFIFPIRLHLAAPPILCLDSFRLSCLFEFVALVSLRIFGTY
ncbi:uncharacterized protein BO88DRAFT_79787 [Aspergillus vadensis CBS 113365]|uniref:Uncharacterized protein n=1 Tax=Aspergillus vadensis (strain CBS 113365 / IMI 142717 / IBT 24658) TaxID=1448311 RepID=A0A319BVZ3_ASPVC|nr:hypothetical protein BO88DRAFT_79787 [Aspergillus vadensis CBS 113365]PYH67298.1 hypothetical protein BO88DRAFT_79787 [Aspergillus vadensis CBS 113365]